MCESCEEKELVKIETEEGTYWYMMPSTPNICFIAPPWLSGFGDTCFLALVRGHPLFAFPPLRFWGLERVDMTGIL